IQEEQILVSFKADTGNVLAQARATGGPVFGPGSETSDSIPALLSNNEHVWSAREVQGAGGHGNVTRLRQLAAGGRIAAFGVGGPLTWSDSLNAAVTGIDDVVARNVAFVRDQLAKMVTEAAPGPAGAGVARWAAMVDQALGIMGQPLAYESITLRRMNQ